MRQVKRNRLFDRNEWQREWMPNETAEIALHLIQHIAIATGTPDGEDSSGRGKMKLLPPGEVAKRACDIAAAIVEEFKTREWTHDVPEPEEETEPKGGDK